MYFGHVIYSVACWQQLLFNTLTNVKTREFDEELD